VLIEITIVVGSFC